MAVLCLLTNTPWPWPTPAGAASAGCAETWPRRPAEGRRKRIPGAARSVFHQLARARDGVPQQVWLPRLARQRRIALRCRCCLFWGLPTLHASKLVMEMAQLCKAWETDEAVSHPSHSRLEDADEARVSHIPTTTATKSDKKGRQQLLLHQASVRSRQLRMPGGSLSRMRPMLNLQHLIKSVSRRTRSWRDSAWIIYATALGRQRTASFMTDLTFTRDGETNLSSTASNDQGSLKCASQSLGYS